MHEKCPTCELRFEREQGYFLGAMYISYPLAVVVIGIFSALAWLSSGWSFERSVLAGVLLFVPLVAPLTRLSRIIWMHIDQGIDPDRT